MWVQEVVQMAYICSTVATNLGHVKSIINGIHGIIADVNIHWLYLNLLLKEKAAFFSKKFASG
jgi:hypothetical protein